jgi:glycosyltransferase involved in cell wall biosynthesis
MKPRILFLDQSGAPGGAELTLLDIVKDSVDHCGVVLFADGEFREVLEEAGARTIVLPLPDTINSFRRESGFAHAFAALPRVPRWILALKRIMADYDVVFANTQKAFVLGAVAARLAGKPFVWSLHDIVSMDHFSLFNRRMMILLANRLSARIIANSQASAASFIAAGGNAAKVGTVPVGIDARGFGVEDAAARQQFRDRLGIGDALLVGSFSRISPWKGQHVLIDAVSKTEGLHALIAGKELFGETEYVRAIHERVRAMGVADRVHFLGFTREVSAALCACDIVVHTSVSPEPFGRVLLEGMLARRPVVATAAGGAMEVIESERSGLLVRPGDSQLLAETLRRLATDPVLRQRLGEEGRRRAETKFSLTSMLDGIQRELTQAGVSSPNVANAFS